MDSRFAWFPLALGLLTACRRTPDSPAAPVAVAVRVVVAARSMSIAPIDASMILARLEETDLSFKTPGIIESVLAREGEAVRRDQILARLKLDEIEADLTRARAAAAKAERDASRARDLLAQKVSTVEQLQNAETALEQSQAAVRAAEFNHRWAIVRAPGDGRILRRWAEPNQTISSGAPVLRFAPDAGGWIAHGGLSQTDVGRIAPGDRAELGGRGFERPVGGVVWRIAGAANPETGATDVEILLDVAPEGARSGFALHARIAPGRAPARSVVPSDALIEGDGDHAAVFIADHGNARRRLVKIESWLGTQVRLETSLPEAAAVITAGAEFLRDGDAIRIVETSASGPIPTPP